MPERRDSAVVLGASMGGLLAARVPRRCWHTVEARCRQHASRPSPVAMRLLSAEGQRSRSGRWSAAQFAPFTRGHAVGGSEHSRETGGIGKPPPPGNCGDWILLKRQGEVPMRSFESPQSDPVAQRDAFGGQDPVELPHRYVMFSGNAAGVEVRFPNVQFYVLHDSYEESGLERILAQVDGVEMGGDRRSKQLNARLTDHFSARAIKCSRPGGQPLEIGDGHVCDRVIWTQSKSANLSDDVNRQRQSIQGYSEFVLGDAVDIGDDEWRRGIPDRQIARAQDHFAVTLAHDGGPHPLQPKEEARPEVVVRQRLVVDLVGRRGHRPHREISQVSDRQTRRGRAAISHEVDLERRKSPRDRGTYHFCPISNRDSRSVESDRHQGIRVLPHDSRLLRRPHRRPSVSGAHRSAAEIMTTSSSSKSLLSFLGQSNQASVGIYSTSLPWLDTSRIRDEISTGMSAMASWAMRPGPDHTMFTLSASSSRG
jgi:hypothetical protein